MRTLAPFLGCIHLKIEAPILTQCYKIFVRLYTNSCLVDPRQKLFYVSNRYPFIYLISTQLSWYHAYLFLSIYLSRSELAAHLQLPMIVLQPIISPVTQPLSGLNLLKFPNQSWNLIELLFSKIPNFLFLLFWRLILVTVLN